jgi:hypothetical protein
MTDTRWMRYAIGLGAVIAVILWFTTRDRKAPAPETPTSNPAQSKPAVTVAQTPSEPTPATVAESANYTVSGRLVLQETGEGLADMALNLDLERTSRNLTARSDAEGYFFFSEVPVGSHVASMADDFLVITPETATIQVAEATAGDEATLMVALGGQISGRVYDADTGKGISGVELDLREKEYNYKVKPQTTNTDGEYRFSSLPAGNYVLSRDDVRGYGMQRRGQDDNVAVGVIAGEEQGGIDFALSKGLQIHGIVVDEADVPIAGVAVHAGSPHNGERSAAKTGNDGTFVLAGFSPNTEAFVFLSTAEYAVVNEQSQRQVKIIESDVTGVRFVLTTAATIEGVVVDAQGNPKPEVLMMARKPASVGHIGTQSQNNGAVIFTGLLAGEYELVFSNLPGEQPDHVAQKVSIKKGEKLAGLKFVYPEIGGLKITGRVTDSRGMPIDDAVVFVMGVDTIETGNDGRYTASGLEAREYRLTASSSEHSSSEPVVVQAGATGVDFVLKDHATIEGRVVSARTGQPVTAFTVGGGEVRDPEGRFRITTNDGVDSVHIRAEGFVAADLKIPPVMAGETRRDVLVRMEEGNAIAGRVVDASGTGIRGVELFLGEVVLSPLLGKGQTTSAVDGRFLFTSVPAGAVTISAVHPDFLPKTISLNVVPGADNRVDIVLSAGGAIEGMVSLNGKPMALQSVAVISRDAKAKHAKSDAAGRYKFSGLADGTVHVNTTLQTAGSPGRSESREVTVTSGFVTEANINFVSGNSSIEGTVYEGPNQPVRGGVWLSALVDTGDGVRNHFGAQTDDAGRYTFDALPAGLVMISVAVDRRPRLQVEVRVGERERVHRDVELFAGATVHANVSVADGLVGARVYVMRGTIDTTSISMDLLLSLESTFAAGGELVGGTIDLPGLEPGTYTVVGLAVDTQAAQAGDDATLYVRLDSEVVELAKDQTVTVQLTIAR